MRTLSNATLAALFAQYTGASLFHLLAITHPQLTPSIYLCDNNVAITSNGITYQPFEMRIAIPVEDPTTAQTAGVEIDNVDLTMATMIETCTGTPPIFTISVINLAEPNTIIAGPFPLELRDSQYISQTFSATLNYEEVLDQVFPGDTMTPGTVPGIFQSPWLNP